MNRERLAQLAERWDARLMASARGEPDTGLNGYMAQGAGMVLEDVRAILADDDPPAPGHRHLHEILADLHQGATRLDFAGHAAHLRREFATAALALFDSQVEACRARRGSSPEGQRPGGAHPQHRARHLGAPGTGCPLCVGAADAPGFSICTERCAGEDL